MDSSKKVPASVDEYIGAFPEDVQSLLETMRQTIQNAAPQAEETIGYGMPTYRLKSNLVHFAAYKNHIGFYPGAKSAIEAFKEPLSASPAVISGKGTLQFPLDKPIPFDLIAEIVKYRVEQDLKK